MAVKADSNKTPVLCQISLTVFFSWHTPLQSFCHKLNVSTTTFFLQALTDTSSWKTILMSIMCEPLNVLSISYLSCDELNFDYSPLSHISCYRNNEFRLFDVRSDTESSIVLAPNTISFLDLQMT
jgi:hypothetical protein